MAELDRLEVQVEAQASAANKQLDSLISKLNKVSQAMTGIKVPAGLGSQASSMSTLAIGASSSNASIKKLTSTLASYTSKLYGATGRTRTMAQMLGSFNASFYPIIRGFKALGRAAEASMNYIETFNYFNVTMDKIGKEFSDQYDQFGYDSAEAYADSFSSRLNDLSKKMTGYEVGDNGMLSASSGMSLGLDPNAIMNYQASIGAITNSVGLVGETSINTSKALTMLAADMSSFKNVDLSTVMTNFQSGLIGQSRALYKYGIDITNATLQTYAYKYGLNMAVSEMTQADKMQLRLLAILDQSKVAWGDQANTINSVANQYRILKQQISNVARTIGNILIPIAQAVLPIINGVMMALGRLFSFIGPLIYGTQKWSGIMDGISSGYGGIDTGDLVGDTDELADSAGDVGSNLDNASKAAKKLQRTILGFDQINKLNDNTSSDSSGSGSTGSGGSGGIDLSDAIGAALADYESVWNKAFENSVNEAQAYANKICSVFDNMWKMLKAGDYEGLGAYIAGGVDLVFEKINSVFNWDKTGPTITAFMDGYTRTINSFVTNVDWANIGKTVGDGLNVITNTMYLWYASIDWINIGNAIADGMNGMINSIDWLMLGRTVGAWIMKIPKMIYGFVTNLDWKGLGTGIGNALNGALMEFDGTIIAGGINGVVHGILDALKAFIKTVDWSEVAKAVGDVLGNLDWGALAAIGLAIGATKLITKFGSTFANLFSKKISDVIEGSVLTGLSNIGKVFAEDGAVGSGITTLGTKMRAAFSSLTGVSLPTSVLFAGVVAGIAIVVAGVMDLWKTSERFRDNVKTMLGIVGDAFKNFKTKAWDEGLKPLWEQIKGFFDSLYGLYESSGLKDVFEIIVTFLGFTLSQSFSRAITIVGSAVKTISNVLGGILQVFSGIIEFISGIFTLDLDKVLSGVEDVFSGTFSAITGLVDGFAEIVLNIFGTSIDGVKETVQNGLRAVQQFFSNLGQYIRDIFTTDWSKQFGTLGSVLDVFLGTIKSLVSSGKQIFKGLTDFISGVFSGDWSKAWRGIKDAFSGLWSGLSSILKSPVNAVMSILEGMANGVIRAFNKIKSLLNSFSIDIPDAFGGGDLGFNFSMTNTISLPRFAEGGFPNTGEMFLARENGITEMVGRMGNRATVANNDQIVDGIAAGVKVAIVEAVAEVAIAMNNNGGESAAPIIENIVKIDSETLFRLAEKGRHKTERRYQTVVQVT